MSIAEAMDIIDTIRLREERELKEMKASREIDMQTKQKLLAGFEQRLSAIALALDALRQWRVS